MNPALIEPTSLQLDELLEEGDHLSMTELHVTPEQLGVAAQAWCWLLSVPEDDDEARDEAMGDAPLMVALVALPVNDFLRWFQGQGWSHFDRSQGAGGTVGLAGGPEGLRTAGQGRADAGGTGQRRHIGPSIRGYAVGHTLRHHRCLSKGTLKGAAFGLPLCISGPALTVR